MSGNISLVGVSNTMICHFECDDILKNMLEIFVKKLTKLSGLWFSLIYRLSCWSKGIAYLITMHPRQFIKLINYDNHH